MQKVIAVVFACLLLSTHAHRVKSHRSSNDQKASNPEIGGLFDGIVGAVGGLWLSSLWESVTDLADLAAEATVQEFLDGIARHATALSSDPYLQKQVARIADLIVALIEDPKVQSRVKRIDEEMAGMKGDMSQLQTFLAEHVKSLLAEPDIQAHATRIFEQVNILIQDAAVQEQAKGITELFRALSSDPKVKDLAQRIAQQLETLAAGEPDAQKALRFALEHATQFFANPNIQDYARHKLNQAKGFVRETSSAPAASSFVQAQQTSTSQSPQTKLAKALLAANPRTGFHAPLAKARSLAARNGRVRPVMDGKEETKPIAAETNKEAEDGSGGVRQLLGLKGAAAADKDAFLNWKIRLQLTKPATWIPLIWGVACGAAASGNYHAIWNLFGSAPTADNWGLVAEDTIKAIITMVLAGPFMCGFTQTINDWYDRELDAINEPYRPIPSGAISEGEVYSQIAFLLIGSIVLASRLDGWAGNELPVITFIASFGAFIAYIYSAPPIKLKAEGWLGTYALGSSYIALPWLCGHGMFNAGSISFQEVILTILYSIAGLGIAIVNDFKSIEGDKKLGMNSLPVAFGVDTAKWICVASIDITQIGVAAYLYAIGETRYAAILAALVLPQMFSQISFLQDPVANDVKYQAAAQPFLVGGILNTALAVGHHTF